MTCPSCGNENQAGAKFCSQCGTRLPAEQPRPVEAASDHGAPTQIGDGRYVIDRFLGEGVRKRVYLAHDTALDRDVAIALVKTAGLDESGRMRVRREAQAMARLGDHPHVVTVHDIGEEGGEPYIVSQYMAGGAVEDLLEQAPERRPDLETGVGVGRGLCAPLEHARRT